MMLLLKIYLHLVCIIYVRSYRCTVREKVSLLSRSISTSRVIYVSRSSRCRRSSVTIFYSRYRAYSWERQPIHWLCFYSRHDRFTLKFPNFFA
uniref:Putative secreted protein n=1 Tax=Panstrongylus lignarius TaxID=156445 RepID=A0A224XYK8_9HEMI